MVGSGSSFTQIQPCSLCFLFVPIEVGLIFKDLQLDVVSIACEVSSVPGASSICTRKHLSVSKQRCSCVLLFTGRGVCVFLWYFGHGLHFWKVASNVCLFQFWIFLHEEYVNCYPGQWIHSQISLNWAWHRNTWLSSVFTPNCVP